jgi:hypothetical protein
VWLSTTQVDTLDRLIKQARTQGRQAHAEAAARAEVETR